MRTATANCAKTACTSSCASTTPSATERWRSRSSSPAPRRTRSRSDNQETASMNVTGLKCADLVDAMGRMHRHRCHILDLVSPTPDRILFGPAATISYFPSCSAALDPEHYNFANLFYEAVGDDPAGKVIVLASNGYTDTSMGGGTKLLPAPSERLRWGAHGRTPARLR